MKILRIILLLLTAALCSCTPNTENNGDQNIETQRKDSISETLPELSIYNLPSTWTTQDGKDIELKELQGDVVVMVMIYTTCKAACARLVADMRNIESQVADADQNVKYVVVSYDPETATLDGLNKFAGDNQMDGDQWVFLRGSEGDTREFAAVLAVSYKAISPIDFSHSNIISVFDREGVLVHQKEGLGVDSKETIATINQLSN